MVDTRPLTDRENEIVYLVAQHLRNKDIAQKLAISEQTVKNNLHTIFGKLGIYERSALEFRRPARH